MFNKRIFLSENLNMSFNLFTFGTQIVVLDDNEETNKTYQQELKEDLLAIIHSYSMKLYTHRKKKLKEIEKIIKSEEEN